MRLIFLGGPGSGKGTQAKKLVERFGLAHISTGDLLRIAMNEGTDLGLKARKYVDAGELVPDEIILEMIKEKIANKNDGFIFDGFPRTIEQAKGLEEILSQLNTKIDNIVNLKVDDSIIIKRLGARRLCAKCGLEYNLETKPPKHEGVCDDCGGELYQRSDDNPEAIGNRLKLYHEKTRPVEDFYRQSGKLIDIDGTKGFDEVFSAIVESVGSR